MPVPSQNTIEQFREKVRPKGKSGKTSAATKAPTDVQSVVKDAEAGYKHDIERARDNKADPDKIDAKSPVS